MTNPKLYLLGDRVPYKYPLCKGMKFMAQCLEIKRKPKKDEWYLSGSKPLAYRAFNDLNSEYHIAKIVIVMQTTIKKLDIISS